MNKKAVFIACLALLFLGSSKAQDRSVHFYLDNYAISSTGKNIATIVTKGGADEKAILLKDTSGLFAVSKDNVLRLKKKTELKGFKYNITIQVGDDRADFVIVKDNFIKNKVIAHRGAWKNTGETENSIGALKKTIQMGCEGSEFDVRMSADSVLFVHHDPDVQGIRIESTAASELHKVKLSNSEPLPTLDAYLKEGIIQNSTRLFLEIKPSVISPEMTIAVTNKTVSAVRALKAQAWIYYISFSYDALKRVRELDPAAKLAYLGGDKSLQQLKADGIDGLDYHYSIFKKENKMIDQARKLGLSTNCWTVDDINDLQFFLKEGVDMITTNEPELLINVIKRK
ncbi:glycerophosphodiester phosphodiesterase [Arcticibacter tournemirensis]|uniref:Glycerophosphodiester phosphodiesterase n=1 Tax=Arcticibacter tournemirensis TaxID=699437 RepID=A0A4Q0MG72_9SPHI|nr:glycerophosphodiester phosphodiesterase family protein [Arcticibacter tournemirensis]RXF72527.1 glycerophosphodiester phosphodiesterase [Arcticibacter tournemirensis]